MTDFSDIERARELPPDDPYREKGGDWIVPACPSCCETDEVASVYDGVEFTGYECDRCDLRFSLEESEKSRRAEG